MIDPSFVVSYQTDSSVRFLQIQIEAMARDEESIEAFEMHSPRIRNDLLLLFASESLDELSTREGKERVRQKAFEQINEILGLDNQTTSLTTDDIFRGVREIAARWPRP